jgi:hypothetical protein
MNQTNTNAPLILIVCDGFFTVGKAHNLRFQEVFRGGLDFFDPKIALSSAQDNLGIKKVLAPSKNPSKSVKIVSFRSENNSLFRRPIFISSYLKKSLKQWEENLGNGKPAKNPQISTGSLQVTRALRYIPVRILNCHHLKSM